MVNRSETVALVINEHIARLQINRADARNALNNETVSALISTLQKIKASDAKVVLLSGAGEQAFCAGADLKELLSLTPTKRGDFFKGIGKVVSLLRNLPIPVVSKIHGYALAGGMGLVAASDIAIASDDATFGLPEIAIGLVPMIVSIPLERTIGIRALSELVLTGEFISAGKAKEIGLITRVVAKQTLEHEAEKTVQKLASRSSAALHAAKKALQDVSEKNFAMLITDFSKRIAALSKGKDFEEGIRAFLEKREPRWLR